MIIDRFGSTYAGAYALPQGLFVDNWAVTRPPVTARIGRMGGAVDFYGGSSYPRGPMIVKKQMIVTGSSRTVVGDEIDELILRTIMVDESKLWGLKRDGSTTRWTYAKCTNLEIHERALNSPIGVPVSIEFFCREGLWHYGSENIQQYATTGLKTIVNAGSLPALLRFELTNSTTTISSVSMVNNTNGDIWQFDGSIPADYELIVDALNYSCTNTAIGVSPPVSAYSGLTIPNGQQYWMRLEPGENSVTVNITPNSGIFVYTLNWLVADQ